MKLIKFILLLMVLFSLNGCLNDTEEPAPKPQTPSPTPQVAED